ncbi:MAG: FAD-dependent oxidoreductase [Planctomycetaceae bacterium]|nr:FAD-dependent oxidoreductase [Planctomycetaceae bacterium]
MTRFVVFLFVSFAVLMSGNSIGATEDLVFIEAEAFADKGGWSVDQQYMDVMGSPVLIAHGMGVPVADASTEVAFPKTGTYRVFIRTRNWVAPWFKNDEHAPGKFQLSVNGKKLDTVFGTKGNPWQWQSGGAVEIQNTKVKLALHDLTGFNGRLDAIIFTADKNYTPPEDIKAIDVIRRKTLHLSASPLEAPEAKEGPFDLVVSGGGIAGICSAISAARLGCKVCLIQNRPQLGGNNSSEVRVHLQGRMGYPPFPNLGNLVNEIDPMQDGNAQTGEVYKDWKKMEAVKKETNITLYLNTQIIAVITDKKEDGSITLKSVIGKNIETGVETKFTGKLFADCTGDGAVGYLAGADWRMGRESKEETGEDLAPEKGDKMTMGSSVQWYSIPATDKDGNPVKTEFPPLPWAHQFTHESAQPMIRGDWDWETGTNFDQVWDIERIRDNGLRAAFGHWAYMKNQSEPKWREQADTRKLGWVAYVAGKRESRRLLGDVILREQDVVQGEVYPDASVITTWSIDLHYPQAKNSKFFPNEEFRTTAEFKHIKPYSIPYRTLYSRNVNNLFMAGRCISVTHVALGTIRVMRTGGMMGEVVGMAASIAVKNNTTPRGVYNEHLEDLKALMTEGVGAKAEKFWHTAAPRTAEPQKKEAKPPVWLPKAGTNFARSAKIKVSSEYKDPKLYPASNINDGKIDLSTNLGRWVSGENEEQNNPHWIELSFDEPVEINAFRVVSGQQGGQTPIRNFVLQKQDGGKWIDVPASAVTDNLEPDVGKQFPAVKSKSYRFLITDSGLVRIYELELYKVESP